MRIRETDWGPHITKSVWYSAIWYYTTPSQYRQRSMYAAKNAIEVLNSIKRK